MHETRNVRPEQAAGYHRQDNYTRADLAQEASVWIGEGAKRLNLSGNVEAETLEQVLQGYAPSGELLRDHTAHQTGLEIGALDCVFAAPKGVSLLAIVHGESDVVEAHHNAAQTAIKTAEQRYAQTRIRLNGERHRIYTENLAIAVFLHDTSRELDPHLHSHNLVMNCTYVPFRQRWYSLDNRLIHDHKKFLGAIYQHELAAGLQNLGYEIEPKSNGQFELKGFTDQQIAHFSKRSQQIQPLLSNGTWADRQRAGAITRARKGELEKRELLDYWSQECEAIGIEFPAPRRWAVVSPSTIEFYDLDPGEPIEIQEQKLFLKTAAPYQAIQTAIAQNVPILYPAPPEPQPIKRQLSDFIKWGRGADAMALMAEKGNLVVSHDPQKRLSDHWLSLPSAQREQSVLVIRDADAVAYIREQLQQQGDYGATHYLTQIRNRPKARLGVGGYLQPTRNYQRRQLRLGELYRVLAIRRNMLELETPEGERISTRKNFQHQVITTQDYPVCEWEPLVWTADPKAIPFAIIGVEEECATIQYRDGSMDQVDISKPLPIQSAIAWSEVPPGQYKAAYVLADHPINLKSLIQQCSEVYLYGDDVKSIAENSINYMARQNPLLAKRIDIQKEIEQEVPLGEYRDSAVLERFRAKHQRQDGTDGNFDRRVIADLSDGIIGAVEERRLRKHAGIVRAIELVHRTIVRTIEHRQQHRYPATQIHKIVGRTIIKSIAKPVATRIHNRQINRQLSALTPAIAKVHQSLHQYKQTQILKSNEIISLSKTIEIFNRQLDERDLIAIAQELRELIPKSTLALEKDGGHEVETRSLKVHVNNDRVLITSKDQRTVLAKIQPGQAINHCQAKELAILRELINKLKQGEIIQITPAIRRSR
jgi:conjugative relaxase-like TrwC/TraI family protein